MTTVTASVYLTIPPPVVTRIVILNIILTCCTVTEVRGTCKVVGQ